MDEVRFTRKRKIILKFTPLSIVLEALALLALIACLLIVDRCYPDLPDEVPTVLGVGGSIEQWGPKETTLLHPILAVFVYIVLFCINLIIRQSCPPDRTLPRLSAALNVLSIAKTLFLLYEAAMTWYAFRFYSPAPGWLLWLLLALEAVLLVVSILWIRRIPRGVPIPAEAPPKPEETAPEEETPSDED